MMTGLEPEAATRELSETIEVVAVKDGVRGAWVRRGEEVHHVPAHPVEVVDTTGAGDCFAAASCPACCANCRSAPAARSVSRWPPIRSLISASSCRRTFGND